MPGPLPTAAALARALQAGELSAVEATDAYLERIAAWQPEVNAYISVQAEEARGAAARLGRPDPARPLWGVPVAVKDIIDVAGVPTTAASAVLHDRRPTVDAATVARLRAAGAIVVGKLNTHEFAFGAMTTSVHFGPGRNPWNRARACGGSSGGSGIAAAADLAAGTLGSDTGGSIRIPGAFNGVTGIRPSTGLVPNRGIVPLAPSFDTVGPIARTVEDCALLLQVIAGFDPDDPSTVQRRVPAYPDRLGGGVAGLRIGVVRPLLESGIDPRVAGVVSEAIAELGSLGGVLRDVSPEGLEDAAATQQATQFVEGASTHLHWLRERYALYGTDVRARLVAGLLFPPTVPVNAQRLRRLFTERYTQLFGGADVLVQPSVSMIAPRHVPGGVAVDGLPELEGSEGAVREDIVRRSIIRMTGPWALVGVPAMTVPCGFVDGMPVGMTIVGPRFGEEVVFRVGHAFQQATAWHEARPQL